MENPRIYNLSERRRLFRYPYRLTSIGWMPHHIYEHRNTVIQGCFICISGNAEGLSETLVNGKVRKTEPSRIPHFSFLPPGTVMNSLRASYHDELFFHYPPECVQAMKDFLGAEFLADPGFFFPRLPEETIAEIRRELGNLDVPGTADRLDQLAIRLFTEILCGRRISGAGRESGRDDLLKLHSVAAVLPETSEALHLLLKRFGYSERTFYREWKKYFSISPAEYKLRKRLDNACRLLLETDLTPGEIAEQCCFSSTEYFYQVFRKRFLTTPGKFRLGKQSPLAVERVEEKVREKKGRKEKQQQKKTTTPEAGEGASSPARGTPLSAK